MAKTIKRNIRFCVYLDLSTFYYTIIWPTESSDCYFLKDANNQPLFNDANIPVAGLIDSLFSCFSNVTAYHTHYIMKALMRCFSIINFDVNKTAHIYVENLHKMIIQAIENPFNPLLVHFIFESLCVLIRRAYTKVEGGIDKYVLPILELIIPRDVIDFVPYALQLTALLFGSK